MSKQSYNERAFIDKNIKKKTERESCSITLSRDLPLMIAVGKYLATFFTEVRICE